jgi:hypothetical protein
MARIVADNVFFDDYPHSFRRNGPPDNEALRLFRRNSPPSFPAETTIVACRSSADGLQKQLGRLAIQLILLCNIIDFAAQLN